jgi:plastocyanin
LLPGSAGAATQTVAMSDHIFWSFATTSSAVTVWVGDTVTWENRGNVWHNTRADDGAWSSPNLRPGQTYSHTFTAPGEYAYTCTLHRVEEMFGTVVVLPAGSPTASHRLFVPLARH